MNRLKPTKAQLANPWFRAFMGSSLSKYSFDSDDDKDINDPELSADEDEDDDSYEEGEDEEGEDEDEQNSRFAEGDGELEDDEEEEEEEEVKEEGDPTKFGVVTPVQLSAEQLAKIFPTLQAPATPPPAFPAPASPQASPALPSPAPASASPVTAKSATPKAAPSREPGGGLRVDPPKTAKAKEAESKEEVEAIANPDFEPKPRHMKEPGGAKEPRAVKNTIPEPKLADGETLGKDDNESLEKQFAEAKAKLKRDNSTEASQEMLNVLAKMSKWTRTHYNPKSKDIPKLRLTATKKAASAVDWESATSQIRNQWKKYVNARVL